MNYAKKTTNQVKKIPPIFLFRFQDLALSRITAIKDDLP